MIISEEYSMHMDSQGNETKDLFSGKKKIAKTTVGAKKYRKNDSSDEDKMIKKPKKGY